MQLAHSLRTAAVWSRSPHPASRRLSWNTTPRSSIPVFSRIFKLIELMTLAAGALITGALIAWFWRGLQPGSAALAFTVSVVGGFEALRFARAYTWERLAGADGQVRWAGMAALATGLSSALCLILLGAPLMWAATWGGVSLVVTSLSIFVLRTLATDRLRHWLKAGRFMTKVAVVGDEAGAALVQRLSMDDPACIAVIGRYSEERVHHDDRSGRRGDLLSLLLDCKLGRVDAIVLAVPAQDRARLQRLSVLLQSCAQDIYTVAEAAEITGPEARPASLGLQSVLLIRENPLKDWRALSKDIFDRIGALGILAVTAPLLLAVATLIRLESPGPVLFRQLRVGYNNQLFWILKFRSMRNDVADALATQQTVRNDPRVTRIGAVLRKLSIDELPQLLNVLRGDMSLVGPRPHAPGTSADGHRVHTLVEGYPRRHLMKPGITGLAQVRGFRGGMYTTQQVADRLAADLEYIRRQSIWLDMKIIIMTVMREARSARAF